MPHDSSTVCAKGCTRDRQLVTVPCGCAYHLECLPFHLTGEGKKIVKCRGVSHRSPKEWSHFYYRYSDEFTRVMVDVQSYIDRGLPWLSFTNVEDPFVGVVEATDCPLCLTSIEPNNMNSHAAMTRCAHVFHTACLAKHFVQLLRGGLTIGRHARATECPNCRGPVTEIWTTAKWWHQDTWKKVYGIPSGPTQPHRTLVELQFNRRWPVEYDMPSETEIALPSVELSSNTRTRRTAR